MRQLCSDLLREWCETLLSLQIKETGNPRLDGALLCPACGRIHGRCFEAMYPFLHMASVSGADQAEIWIKAAEQLFDWADSTVYRPEGYYLNDIESEWIGTTVFNAIQLVDCLHHHGTLLSETTRIKWTNRLKQVAEYLYTFDAINDNNINYPISNALALYECGLFLKDNRYMEKAGILAEMAQEVQTEHHLLFGEGIPRFQKSPGGCRPIDIGYNVEETLPSLALYGKISGDQKALYIAEQGLQAHLTFMMDNGAWDNSFGTRNFKWTYWGSRTSDGCALGYLLFAETHPEFAAAAQKNITLLKECTYDGLLSGGPHYQAAGQPICVHHTFTHAKVLAGILDRKLYTNIVSDGEVLLPRQKADGIHHYPEIGSWLINLPSMTATVTAYDWEYMPGGHVSGGTLSFLHHFKAGTLLCAGMSEYTTKEPNNMQVPVGVKHECLALRIETQVEDHTYSSIYEDSAHVTVEGNRIMVSGDLKNIHHQTSDLYLPYQISYTWEEDNLHVKAEFKDGILICPLISPCDENIELSDAGNEVRIQKEQSLVHLKSSGTIKLPYATERIFNLVPGLQALRVDMEPNAGNLEFSITITK